MSKAAQPSTQRPAAPSEPHANPYGHFARDGREFLITNVATPRPWSNIIANERVGLAVSQTGSGFSWIDNSQLAVVNRWQQEFAEDTSGKFLYIRDADTDEVWSLAPAPTWAPLDHYECRHGLGYTTFVTEKAGIRAHWTLFVHPSESVEGWLVELENRAEFPRRLELCAFLEWNCGVAPAPRREFQKLFLETRFDPDRGAILARSHMWEAPNERFGHWNTSYPYTSALAASEPVYSAQGDKAAFLGRYGSVRVPAALRADTWKPLFGRHHDPIAALRCQVELRGGERRQCAFTLSTSRDPEEVPRLVETYTKPDVLARALADAQSAWEVRLAGHRVNTPDESLNHLTNDWLRYQAISGRIWGRAGYYQQSGAYGFRDQLQDSQVWLPIDPQRTRDQLNLHARHQFVDGSVYHWWHPLTEQGHVTRMTDDLLWLAFVTAAYIRETGDLSVLDDASPFLDDPTPQPLSSHIERAFVRVFQRTSPRGLPHIGAGDWNDGLSAAGLQEQGESVWLGQFLAGLLADWQAICSRRGEPEAAERAAAQRQRLLEALNRHGWDGGWYLRATLDDGSKLGSCENTHGRIFLNAQTWAILNRIGDPPRLAQCWQAVKEHLITPVGALLLAPAFEAPREEVGYITRYAPGLRENGGVYTHAATWAIAAACEMQDGEAVGQLLDAINPAVKDPESYWAEPYVLPGNVDGPQSPYFGRGGWTWYTGSAAWLHRVITQFVLGVRPDWDGLRIAPCLPPDWTQARMTRPWRGATYEIEIARTGDERCGVWLDGEPLMTSVIPPPSRAGSLHTVTVRY